MLVDPMVGKWCQVGSQALTHARNDVAILVQRRSLLSILLSHPPPVGTKVPSMLLRETIRLRPWTWSVIWNVDVGRRSGGGRPLCSWATHGFGWHFNLGACNAFQRRAVIVKQFLEVDVLGCADSLVPIELVFEDSLR